MQNQEKTGLRKRLSARYGSSVGMRGKDMVVMRGGRGATVYGCQKILYYSPREIRLGVGKRTLSVIGEGLYCAAFGAGTVTVEGCVMGVTYLEEKMQSAKRKMQN